MSASSGDWGRMLRDDRTLALAVEFGTQWVHVRGFDELKEKNEADKARARAAMREKSRRLAGRAAPRPRLDQQPP